MNNLTSRLDKLHIPYNAEKINALREYMVGILGWNEKINLTGITDEDQFILKHFIDSLLIYNMKEYDEAHTVIDMGTGGGFPGIPLAIMSEDKKFVLTDSLNKRLKVIDELTSQIGITNVITCHGRAEDLGRSQDHREKYDMCVSRAVASLPTLCEYCLPFVKVGGFFLAYKGPDCQDEIKAAEKAITVLGGELVKINDVDFEGFEHKILVIKKIKSTPKKYPRKAGTPSKQPL